MRKYILMIIILIFTANIAYTADIAVFPWTETFESDSDTINLWTQEYVAGNANWTLGQGSTGGQINTANSGIRNARYVSIYGNNSPVTKLITPVLDLSGLANPTLEFYYGQEQWGGDQNTLEVFYRQSESDPWVSIWYSDENLSSWTQVILPLPNPTGNYQIAFQAVNNYGHANVLDDVTVFGSVDYEVQLTQVTPDMPVQTGESAYYRLSVKNIGTLEDNYTFALSKGWAEGLYADTDDSPLDDPLVLDALESAELFLKVNVPVNADIGDISIDTVTVSGLTSANDSIAVTTTAAEFNHGETYEYNFANSLANVDYAPEYEWIDLLDEAYDEEELTYEDDLSLDEWTIESPVDIGFDFPFYHEGNKTAYNSVMISMSGYIQFVVDTAYPSVNNQGIPSVFPPDSFIAFYWDALWGKPVPPETGIDWTPKTLVWGNEEMFVISFIDYIVLDDTSESWHEIMDKDQFITAQIILYSNGDIKIQYKEIGEGIYNYTPVSFSPNMGTAGIENQNGTKGIQYRFNGIGGPLEGPTGDPLALMFYFLDSPPIDEYQVDILIDPANLSGIANPQGAGVYEVGSEVTVSVQAIDGYIFNGWTAEGISLDDPLLFEQAFNMPENDVNFTAHYEQITITAPWTETFENNSPTRHIWTQEFVTGEALWSFGTGAGHGSINSANTGDLNARYVSSGSLTITKLVTPVLDISHMNSPMIEFYYGQELWEEEYWSDHNELKVYYRSGTRSDWIEIAHFADNIDEWTLEELELPNKSAHYQIAFEGINNFGYRNVLDDISVFDGEPTVEYTVTIQVDPSAVYSDASPTGDGDYESGETVNISVQSVDGYAFTGWSSEPLVSFADHTALETSFSMPDDDVVITANYEEIIPEEYTVTIQVDPSVIYSDALPTGDGDYESGETVNITVQSVDGYTFTGWSSEPEVTFADNSALSTTFTMPAENVTVIANYEEDDSDCDPIDTLPYFKAFDDYNDTPDCWQNIDQSGEGFYWEFGIISGLDLGTEGNYAFIDSDDAGSGNDVAADLLTPVFDLTNYENGIVISFIHYYWHLGNSSATLLYSIDNGATWEIIETWNTSSGIGDEFSAVVEEVGGHSEVLFAWSYDDGGSWAWYWAVDNILIEDYIAPDEYTVTMEVDPEAIAGDADPQGAGDYEEGDTVSISVQEVAGYSFTGWISEPLVSFTDPGALETSFTMPDYDVLVTAIYDLSSGGPDASISSGDISFLPETPMLGDTVEITARAHNIGTEDIASGIANFYFSLDPGEGLELIESESFALIESGGYIDLQVDWDTSTIMESGEYFITVSLEDILPSDIDMSNNTAVTNIMIGIVDSGAITWRFFNQISGGHLYTISEHERDYIIGNLDYWNFEGPVYQVLEESYPGTLQAYRFFNTNTGIHLYTTSEIERDYIIDNYTYWNYEGPTFFVYETQMGNTIPVFRFFNTIAGGHLYTTSEIERDYIMENYDWWNYEGIAFYVLPL